MSNGTYSHSNRHRMHEQDKKPEILNLKRENAKLREQIFQLTKDEIRLDWLQSSDITLHHWDEGGIWAKSGMYTVRECIDREIEEEMREREAGRGTYFGKWDEEGYNK